jgi:hypothetical protein
MRTTRGFVIALAAAGMVAAGLVGCAHAPSPSTAASATGSAPTTPQAGQSSHTAWQTDDVSALTGAPPVGDSLAAYVFEAQGTQHVVYEAGSDHHIEELWSDSTGWHTEDLTAATGAPPAGAGDLAGYVLAAQGTQHVVYEAGSDHHIEELWSDSTGWHTEDLTAATGAPPLVDDGPLMAYAFEAQGTQHVFYEGPSDRHIHELWSDSTGWHTDDVTAATAGAVQVGGPLAGYVDATQGTQHVVYVGLSDKHIHDLWWDTTGRHTDDLTAATGAPTFGDGLAAYAFAAQGTQHVIYGDDNYPSHLHELWSDPTGWHTDDLTAATGAPPGGGACRNYGAPCAGLPGYVFQAQGTQHVIYVSYLDGHIHELWWGPRQSATTPTSSAAPTPTINGAATQIINDVAVNSGGQPINGYRETNNTGSNMNQVDCTEPSPAAVSANVYYCSPTAAGADVCWPASGLDLLCMDDPWAKNLHRIHARAPLPQVSPPQVPAPVGLLLEDGNRCRLRNGGSWARRDDGYNGAYRCGGGVAVLVKADGSADAIDRSAPVWTVKVGRLGAPGESLPAPTTVSVATAWFASN